MLRRPRPRPRGLAAPRSSAAKLAPPSATHNNYNFFKSLIAETFGIRAYHILTITFFTKPSRKYATTKF